MNSAGKQAYPNWPRKIPSGSRIKNPPAPILAFRRFDRIYTIDERWHQEVILGVWRGYDTYEPPKSQSKYRQISIRHTIQPKDDLEVAAWVLLHDAITATLDPSSPVHPHIADHKPMLTRLAENLAEKKLSDWGLEFVVRALVALACLIFHIKDTTKGSSEPPRSFLGLPLFRFHRAVGFPRDLSWDEWMDAVANVADGDEDDKTALRFYDFVFAYYVVDHGFYSDGMEAMAGFGAEWFDADDRESKSFRKLLVTMVQLCRPRAGEHVGTDEHFTRVLEDMEEVWLTLVSEN